MARPFIFALVIFALFACGGSDFSTKDGVGGNKTNGSAPSKANGSGGTKTNGMGGNGGQSTTNENAEGGSTAVDCELLWRTYLGAVDAARVCDPAAGDSACNAEWVLPGPCGCNVLVNAQSEAYSVAKSKYESFLATECDLAACACPSEGNAESTPQCTSGGNGSSDGVFTCKR